MKGSIKVFLTVTALCVLLLVSCVTAFATDGEPASPEYAAEIDGVGYASFADAISAANGMEEAVITLLQDIELSANHTITSDVTVTGEHTLTRANGYTKTLFTVNAGAALTVDGGVVIDGNNEWTMDMEAYNADLMSGQKVSDGKKYFTPEADAPIATASMIVTSGELNLNDITIKNHYANGECDIVSAKSGANVTLTGANIVHNAITSGSGLVVNASGGSYDYKSNKITVTVNKGTVIDGNHIGGNHGVFKVYLGSTLTINGGEIKNTTGWNANGVVVGTYYGQFIMNGGTICSNSSVGGPNNSRNAAIYVHNGSNTVMNDGLICHNTGAYGGVDAPKSSSTTTINGGAIINNVSYSGNRYHDIYAIQTTVINGGVFTQDVSGWLAPDCGLVWNEEEGVYELSKELIEVNGTVYPTFQEAIEAAENGDTVKLLLGYEVNCASYTSLADGRNAVLLIDKDIVLDLNGQYLKFDTNVDLDKETGTKVNFASVFYVDGAELTIVGEGEVTVSNGAADGEAPALVLGGDNSSCYVKSGTYSQNLSENQFAELSKGSSMQDNGDGTWTVLPCAHAYDHDCDGECNICDEIRVIEHTYSNACDKICNVCRYIRTDVVHKWDNSCDTECNICGAARVVAHVYDNDCDAVCNVCDTARQMSKHVYTNACDPDCDECGAKREASHTYDNACDTDCNACGAERDTEHKYAGDCDAHCDVCGAEREADKAHTYDNDCDGECNICGEGRETAGHVYYNGCDVDCNVCGAKCEASAHVYDNACDAGCNLCRVERQIEGHRYDDDNDEICNNCGESRKASGDESAKDDTDSKGGGLTTGAIVAIVIGCVLAVGVVIIVIFKKRR